jgi:hypothetical protein
VHLANPARVKAQAPHDRPVLTIANRTSSAISGRCCCCGLPPSGARRPALRVWCRGRVPARADGQSRRGVVLLLPLSSGPFTWTQIRLRLRGQPGRLFPDHALGDASRWSPASLLLHYFCVIFCYLALRQVFDTKHSHPSPCWPSERIFLFILHLVAFGPTSPLSSPSEVSPQVSR